MTATLIYTLILVIIFIGKKIVGLKLGLTQKQKKQVVVPISSSLSTDKIGIPPQYKTKIKALYLLQPNKYHRTGDLKKFGRNKQVEYAPRLYKMTDPRHKDGTTK